ncbi:MAG: hypothetical protein H7282_01560 [Cytophagaceae bacterium]|nr:hypothetical protein [Cytophagaceae bacterium]
MQFSLNRIIIKGDSPILLLGLGGGSAVKIIRSEFLKKNHIDIVDIDSVMIEIARKEFGLNDYSDLKVYCQNASSFVEETNNKYGLVIIDLFIDKITPEYFYDSIFWTDVLMLTKKKCCIIFNTLTANNFTDKINCINKMLIDAKFEVYSYKEIELSNTVLIAKRR